MYKVKREKDWLESEAEIVKIGNLYYLSIRGNKIGKKFRTLAEAKGYCNINGVIKAKYFHGGEFRRVVIC